jgi:glucose/arabinose dehydrogenase
MMAKFRRNAGTMILVCFLIPSSVRAQIPVAEITVIARFNQPWAMAFLPDGRLLVTEKQGHLQLYTIDGNKTEISGIPAVDDAGQGGLGDIVLHPRFVDNRLVYLSYAEPGEGGRAGAAVARAELDLDTLSLQKLEVVWRQYPKVRGSGHFGHRIAFDAQGYLFISSGERQQFDPAQQMEKNLGKIVRLHDDGAVPADNPWFSEGGVTAQIWTLGHRNPLGLAFDGNGRLWNVEMGPRGGDELNLVLRGANYGYPLVSEGRHYSGINIPDHVTRPEFNAPVVSWNPVISPSSLMFYSGSQFPEWQGNAFIGGLSSESLVRVEFEGLTAREAERFNMRARIRAVTQGPEGNIWILQDGDSGGSLLRLQPRAE